MDTICSSPILVGRISLDWIKKPLKLKRNKVIFPSSDAVAIWLSEIRQKSVMTDPGMFSMRQRRLFPSLQGSENTDILSEPDKMSKMSSFSVAFSYLPPRPFVQDSLEKTVTFD